MTAQEPTRKRYSLFILAIVLLLLGGAALVLGSHDFAIRAVGNVCVIVSVVLVRASNVHTKPTATVVRDQPGTEHGKDPGLLMWMVGALSLLMAGASYFWLYLDALHGYHETLPVYVFAGVALACALVWSYLIAKLVWAGGK